LDKNLSHIPYRTCIGCFRSSEKYSLIRFVFIGQKSRFEIDPKQIQNGKGYYVCLEKECIRRLFKSRKFKQILSLVRDEDIEKFKQILFNMIQTDPIQSLVGLARKAGKVCVGQRAVEVSLKMKQAKLVILAQDTSKNTREQVVRINEESHCDIYEIGMKNDWGALFGRQTVAVFAVLNPNFARAIISEINKLKKQSDLSSE